MCIVPEGDAPHISWSFQGSDVTTHTHKGISTTKFGQRSSILVIDPVEFSLNVTCTAKNSAGTVNYTTELVVQSGFYMIA
jgi:hypothetical protein